MGSYGLARFTLLSQLVDLELDVVDMSQHLSVVSIWWKHHTTYDDGIHSSLCVCVFYRLFLRARFPFTALAFSIAAVVGNCMSWSYAKPPTANVLAAQSGIGCPRSGALKAASTARTVLMAYTVKRPLCEHTYMGSQQQ